MAYERLDRKSLMVLTERMVQESADGSAEMQKVSVFVAAQTKDKGRSKSLEEEKDTDSRVKKEVLPGDPRSVVGGLPSEVLSEQLCLYGIVMRPSLNFCLTVTLAEFPVIMKVRKENAGKTVP